MREKYISLILAMENNKLISSIRRGLIILIPILTAGSLATVLNSFPIQTYRQFITTFAGGFLSNIFVFIANATVGFIAGYLLLSITFFYSRSIAPEDDNIVHTCLLITALASFVILFQKPGEIPDVSYFGHIGVFAAIITAILSTRIFHTVKSLFKNPIKYYSNGVDERFKYSVLCILPVGIVILLFALINIIIASIFGGQGVSELFSTLFLSLFRNIDNQFIQGLVSLLIIHVAWFFGIHGGNLINQAVIEIFQPLDTVRDSILSKLFMDTFTLFGGSGSTLCLIIAMLLFSASKNDKKLSKAAMPFAIFNVNEFLLFGLPVILNPIMLIPFVLVPIISYIFAYLITLSGIIPVAHTSESLAWTTPPLISGYLSTDSINGLIAQIFIITVGVILYIPFVKLNDKIHERREIINIQKLTNLFKGDMETGKKEPYAERSDEIGEISRVIISQLKQDIVEKKIPLFYQPIMEAEGNVHSAEALLRWKYKDIMIFPPLLVTLAQYDSCFEELTQVILETAASDVKKVSEKTGSKMKFSVNISTEQLNNLNFVEYIINIVNTENLNGQIFLEITEDNSLENLNNITSNIDKLSKYSIGVYIDDFSMGSTSIKYLQNNSFMTVKLDGDIVKEISTNSRSKNIAKSIVNLGKELGFDVVAEYVETEELRDELIQIGVKYLQGYLYSPAISADNLICFINGRCQ